MIPKIAHCLFGLRSDFGGKPFSFIHWAAIKSFKKHHPDFTIRFWHRYLPAGPYFEDCLGDVSLHSIEPPTEIFGRPLVHFAHQADVVRLRLLIEHGGIYFDLDSFTVRPVAPLLDHAFVMGQQMHDMGQQLHHGQPRGLCNAIMMGEKNADFAHLWLDSYRSFRSRGRDGFWDEHSVLMPQEIARSHPALVTIVSSDCFFLPDWTPQGIKAMFIESCEFPGAFIHHLWESAAWKIVSELNEHSIQAYDSTYARLVKTHLADELHRLAAVNPRVPTPAPDLAGLLYAEEESQVSRDPDDPTTWGPIRRNESCPCGSGRRYKSCHGAAV